MADSDVWERMTNASTRVIYYAQEEARRLGMSEVGTGHLLIGILQEETGVAAQVLIHLGITIEQVQAEYSRHVRLPDPPTNLPERLTLSSTGKNALFEAMRIWRKMKSRSGLQSTIDTEHLLLGLLSPGSHCLAGRLLESLGVSCEQVRQAVTTYCTEAQEWQSETTEIPEVKTGHSLFEDLSISMNDQVVQCSARIISSARWFFVITLLAVLFGSWAMLVEHTITPFSLNGINLILSSTIHMPQLGLTLSFVLACLYISTCIYAFKGSSWAFLFGIIGYGIDSVQIFHVAMPNKIFSVLFHLFVLSMLCRGLDAVMRLKRIRDAND